MDKILVCLMIWKDYRHKLKVWNKEMMVYFDSLFWIYYIYILERLKIKVSNKETFKTIENQQEELRRKIEDIGLALRTTLRCPWKFISRVYRLFLQLVILHLGKGDKVRFWEDTWVGDQPLKVRFLNLFRIDLLKNKPLSLFYNGSVTANNSHIISWDLQLGRNFKESKSLIFVLSLMFFRILACTKIGRILGCGYLGWEWIFLQIFFLLSFKQYLNFLSIF